MRGKRKEKIGKDSTNILKLASQLKIRVFRKSISSKSMTMNLGAIRVLRKL